MLGRAASALALLLLLHTTCAANLGAAVQPGAEATVRQPGRTDQQVVAGAGAWASVVAGARVPRGGGDRRVARRQLTLSPPPLCSRPALAAPPIAGCCKTKRRTRKTGTAAAAAAAVQPSRPPTQVHVQLRRPLPPPPAASPCSAAHSGLVLRVVVPSCSA